MAKRVVTRGHTGEVGPGNLVGPFPPSGVFGGAQGNFSADNSMGSPGSSGTLGGTVMPNGGVLQGVVAPPGYIGQNGNWVPAMSDT
ncbi:hypothetical protein G6F54_014096 [Rhizopus delemar]|nr:hypothetical protein G6F54_014096 [Rhizopus delemar]